jgi:polyhydroxybutyrate depolymerase
MDRLADQEGFLVLYPQGTGRFEGRLLTWNAGACCGYALEEDVDDVDFVLTALEDLTKRTPIDRDRVYATGLSNGAMMAYRLAVEASERITAIAPVAGGMVVDSFAPTRPVPVMHIHSADDPRAPYAGGLGPPHPLTHERVHHPSIEETLAQWTDNNGCPATPSMGPIVEGEPGSEDQGHTAVKHTYAPCQEGSSVVHWKLTGAGHVWPGGERDYLEVILGPSTTIMDANKEMWGFFSRFDLERP